MTHRVRRFLNVFLFITFYVVASTGSGNIEIPVLCLLISGEAKMLEVSHFFCARFISSVYLADVPSFFSDFHLISSCFRDWIPLWRNPRPGWFWPVLDQLQTSSARFWTVSPLFHSAPPLLQRTVTQLSPWIPSSVTGSVKSWGNTSLVKVIRRNWWTLWVEQHTKTKCTSHWCHQQQQHVSETLNHPENAQWRRKNIYKLL